MKDVKSVEFDKLYRGNLMIVTTKDGEVIPFKFKTDTLRQVGLRILRMLGTKKGEGE